MSQLPSYKHWNANAVQQLPRFSRVGSIQCKIEDIPFCNIPSSVKPKVHQFLGSRVSTPEVYVFAVEHIVLHGLIFSLAASPTNKPSSILPE